MNGLRQILNQNWIGTLVGFGGILVGIVLAFSLRPRPRLATQINTLQIVGPNSVLPNAIEFLFKGQKVPTVTMSRVAIWNVGNTTLRGEQIVAGDPLRIVTAGESTILEAIILRGTRQVNGVSCPLRQGRCNEVQFKFDFLDPNDGALMQLIHTGDDKLSILGTLRGVPKRVVVSGVSRNRKGQEQVPTSTWAARLSPLLVLLLGLTFVLFVRVIWDVDRTGSLMILIMGLLLIFMSPFALWATMRFPPAEIGTQITSNVPTNQSWRRWLKK